MQFVFIMFIRTAYKSLFSVADPGFEVRGGGGGHFLGIRFAPTPLRGFPEATIQVYTWIS